MCCLLATGGTHHCNKKDMHTHHKSYLELPIDIVMVTLGFLEDFVMSGEFV